MHFFSLPNIHRICLLPIICFGRRKKIWFVKKRKIFTQNKLYAVYKSCSMNIGVAPKMSRVWIVRILNFWWIFLLLKSKFGIGYWIQWATNFRTVLHTVLSVTLPIFFSVLKCILTSLTATSFCVISSIYLPTLI